MFTPADANLWILATFAGTAKKLGKLEERHQDSPKKAKIEELAARFETFPSSRPTCFSFLQRSGSSKPPEESSRLLLENSCDSYPSMR